MSSAPPEPTPAERSGVIQVVIIPTMRPALEEWLDSRMCVLARVPGTDPDDLPVYVIQPNDVIMDALMKGEG